MPVDITVDVKAKLRCDVCGAEHGDGCRCTNDGWIKKHTVESDHDVYQLTIDIKIGTCKMSSGYEIHTQMRGEEAEIVSIAKMQG